MQTLIRVVSLPEAKDRRAAFTTAARDFDVDYAFFDAHRRAAPFLINDVEAQRRILGCALEMAEVGCYSSHVTIWREFLESEAAQVIVIEDDVVVDWPFIRFISDFDFSSSNIEYFKMYSKIASPKFRVCSPFLTRYHGLYQNTDLSLGTQAYLMTRTGATRLIKHSLIIRRPIDHELDRAWVHGVPSLEIVPSPVFERFVPSTIGDGRFRRETVSRYRFARVVEKGRKIAYRLLPSRARVTPPSRWS